MNILGEFKHFLVISYVVSMKMCNIYTIQVPKPSCLFNQMKMFDKNTCFYNTFNEIFDLK